MTTYSLSTPQERNGKTYWTRIGTMFEMKGGAGFSLVFNALPIPALNKDGQLEVRVVAFPPKDEAGPGQEEPF
jgi:hypothetical protein